MEINDEGIVIFLFIFLYKNDEKMCFLLLDCYEIYLKFDKFCVDDIIWMICVVNERVLEILG